MESNRLPLAEEFSRQVPVMPSLDGGQEQPSRGEWSARERQDGKNQAASLLEEQAQMEEMGGWAGPLESAERSVRHLRWEEPLGRKVLPQEELLEQALP